MQHLLSAEQEAMRRGGPGHAQAIARSNQRMRLEVRNAMDYITGLHAEIRQKVWTQQEAAREHLVKSITDRARDYLSAVPPASVVLLAQKPGTLLTSPTGDATVPVAEAAAKPALWRAWATAKVLPLPGWTAPLPGASACFLDAESLHREEVSALWGECEKFSIRAAMTNQISRVYAEWAEYLGELDSSYITEYRAAVGSFPDALPDGRQVDATGRVVVASDDAAASGPRVWLEKEKQEQLIHTAPVLAPTAASRSRRSSGRSGRARHPASSTMGASSAAASMAHRYLEVRTQTLAERTQAVASLRRNAGRMLQQVDAAALERASVAEQELGIQREWTSIATLLWNCCVLVAARHSIALPEYHPPGSEVAEMVLVHGTTAPDPRSWSGSGGSLAQSREPSTPKTQPGALPPRSSPHARSAPPSPLLQKPGFDGAQFVAAGEEARTPGQSKLTMGIANRPGATWASSAPRSGGARRGSASPGRTALTRHATEGNVNRTARAMSNIVPLPAAAASPGASQGPGGDTTMRTLQELAPAAATVTTTGAVGGTNVRAAFGSGEQHSVPKRTESMRVEHSKRLP